MISYLPYPHLFEQTMAASIMIGCGRIGYFNGNTNRLLEDCQSLQPNIFPSVPRLYNKLYAKI